MPEDITKESSYDQKAFLQIRLHELLKRIDTFNGNPNFFNPIFSCYNYQVIFQDLQSVFQTIYSKLNDDEKKKGMELRNAILPFVQQRPFYKTKDGLMHNITLKQQIQDKLFIFRCYLEDCMDSHGFNPSKDDLGKAIIKM